MSDTDKIAEVLTALQAAVDAQHEHNKQLEDYDGYSWDYHGYSWVVAMDDAYKRFEGLFQEYIDERVHAAIDKAKGEPSD